MNRRRFLFTAGGCLLAGGAAYTYWRGVRVPLLHFTDDGPATAFSGDGLEIRAEGAVFQQAGEEAVRFRAFVPEPVLTVRGEPGREVRMVVENLHPGAALEPGGEDGTPRSIDEERDNLARAVTIEPAGSKESVIGWRFPKAEAYRFAAIGDSGGGTELEWVLERAAELEADFLIHMGDFYYQKGDAERAPANLNAAALPTYAAIGNHDFHDGLQALYPGFVRTIGPMNSRFNLGGIEFVNFDTAADFIPAVRGHRARLLESLQPVDASNGIRDRVAITHKPLTDPDAEREHDVDRNAEVQWLRERLTSTGTRKLLAGHIHIREEFDDQGIHTYIAGQGLGHADLITQRQYADILIGEVEPGEPVRYRWEPLNMPFEMHCSERNFILLDNLERPEVKKKLMTQCGKG